MTHIRFLKIALPAIAIPALVVLVLPEKVMEVYVDVLEPVALLIGSFLALWVSYIYRKQMKAAFIFLSIFLLVYAVAIILLLAYNPILVPLLETRLGTGDIHSLVIAVQFINYAILLFFCYNLLKAVNVAQLSKGGWISFVVTVVFCLLLALYPVKDLLADVSSLALTEIFTIIIRVLDALLIITLMPVIWLYIQYLRSQQQQSLTFTVIISGIVCATVFDYMFQFITTLLPDLLPENSVLYSSIPELLFIFGYLIIAVGLYAHRKQDEWGFQTIDKMMSGDIELVGDL